MLHPNGGPRQLELSELRRPSASLSGGALSPPSTLSPPSERSPSQRPPPSPWHRSPSLPSPYHPPEFRSTRRRSGGLALTDFPNPRPAPRQPASIAAGERDIGVIADQIARALGRRSVRGSQSMPEGLLVEALSAAELREHVFRECLDATDVDCDELRRIVWAHGVPDRPWARPIAWKLLLGYLPPERVEWDNVLRTRRAEYWHLVAQLTVDPSAAGVAGDHPLNSDTGSRWAEYFRNKELREVIEKDVMRTHSDLHRFLPLRDALRRILFVYAKDPSKGGEAYRQGMNELVAPLLLVFADAPFVHVSDAEADAFYCFQTIMADMSSAYIVKETETVGIGRQIQELQALLRIKDPRLEAHLTQLGINARFYALRWIRVWLTREFDIPDALRVWDSLLAADIRLPWLRYVCVAMLIRIRSQLLGEDFAGCMRLLLHYPPCDIAELLQVADRLRTANVTIVRTASR